MVNPPSNPLITIGITSYNAVDTIGLAINSALNQTWPSFEIVIVDDSSTDGTIEVIKNTFLSNSKIKFFCNEKNYGVAMSRNQIIARAKGEFLCFFDDDDISQPDRLAVQFYRIINYEKKFAFGNPVICHTARRVIYSSNLVNLQPTIGQIDGILAPNGYGVAKRILIGTSLKNGYGACPTCSQMARLSTYIQNGGFDPNLRRGEDTEFNIRLAIAGAHFVGIETPLVVQYMTKTPDKSLLSEYESMKYITEKHKDFISGFGKYDFCLEWLKAKKEWLQKNYLNFFLATLKLITFYPSPTIKRFLLSLSNLKLNRAFSRFHNQ